MYSEEIMKKIIKAYEENGIVLGSDCESLNSRAFSRGLCEEMKRRGYHEAEYTEECLENYLDYGSVLYNRELFNVYDAKNYLNIYLKKSYLAL